MTRPHHALTPPPPTFVILSAAKNPLLYPKLPARHAPASPPAVILSEAEEPPYFARIATEPRPTPKDPSRPISLPTRKTYAKRDLTTSLPSA